jgi:hypothetical protein
MFDEWSIYIMIACVNTTKMVGVNMQERQFHIALKGIHPVVVAPSQACVLLNMGMTRCYELMNSGALESFKDGKSRKITVRSIEAYVQRRLEGIDEREGHGVRMDSG